MATGLTPVAFTIRKKDNFMAKVLKYKLAKGKTYRDTRLSHTKFVVGREYELAFTPENKKKIELVQADSAFSWEEVETVPVKPEPKAKAEEKK